MTSPLVTTARSYLGTRFRHHGRSSHCLDCVGLIWRVYADLGVTLPDVRFYGREPHNDGLMTAARAGLGAPVPQEGIQPGDVGVFSLSPGGEPHHVGFIGSTPYGALSIIHADSLKRAVVEQRLDEWWRARVCAVFRRPL